MKCRANVGQNVKRKACAIVTGVCIKIQRVPSRDSRQSREIQLNLPSQVQHSDRMRYHHFSSEIFLSLYIYIFYFFFYSLIIFYFILFIFFFLIFSCNVISLSISPGLAGFVRLGFLLKDTVIRVYIYLFKFI
ncbi:hypothetical protein PUN28_018653 [Cardiocondyla obscurior]|uniref:Transmembrane protein n=1 Tax=Cardiocondyla obscurior TaxID=286306 RepID=A0AAW2EIS3_9HYME